VRTEFYSNGTLLADRVIRRILPTLGRMVISFDGATRETFEAIRSGASYEKVVANVKSLVAAARELPPERRPVLGFSCTLMRRNIEELPRLVEFAAELGIDFVYAAHVYAVTREMQDDSLARHPELAARCIREAADRAAALGFPFTVQPLGQIEAAMAAADALPDRFQRSVAEEDGHGAGLAGVSVNEDRIREWPTAPVEGGPPRSEKEARRRAFPRPERSALPAAPTDPQNANGDPPPIWTCDFLWKKVYVGREGAVYPCCVPGTPVVGNLQVDDFTELWNGDVYRAMRLALVRRDPVPVCKGCHHIHEVRDPAEIAAWLEGRVPPAPATDPLPPELRPILGPLPSLAAAEPRTSTAPPVLSWNPEPEAEGYEIEMSRDDFCNVDFSTRWHALEVGEPTFEVPAWTWQLAPLEQPVAWRALALLPRSRRVVAGGRLQRTEP
jgi:MoaA/NifB/PqqE/SkfB family radical SAM enzyme